MPTTYTKNIEIIEFCFLGDEPLTEQEKDEYTSWVEQHSPDEDGVYTTENFGFPIKFSVSIKEQFTKD
jgi:hypothetical protein